jgi:hypothetical protein
MRAVRFDRHRGETSFVSCIVSSAAPVALVRVALYPDDAIFSGARKSSPLMLKNVTMPASFTQGWFSFSGLNWDIPAGNYWIAVETEDASDNMVIRDGTWTGPVSTLGTCIGANSAWAV